MSRSQQPNATLRPKPRSASRNIACGEGTRLSQPQVSPCLLKATSAFPVLHSPVCGRRGHSWGHSQGPQARQSRKPQVQGLLSKVCATNSSQGATAGAGA